MKTYHSKVTEQQVQDVQDRMREQALVEKADSALDFAFGKEWRKLREFAALKELVITDFLNRHADDGLSSPEYAKLVGVHNLLPWSNTLCEAMRLNLTRIMIEGSGAEVIE